MNKKIGLLFGALLASLAACGNFAIFQTSIIDPINPAAVVCNVITGVATGTGAGTCAAIPATCNGVADDSPAFETINDWAVNTWQASHSGIIELYIPPGSNCLFSSSTAIGPCGPAGIACPFLGILQARINGYGATISELGFYGAYGMNQNANSSARTQSANSGDSCVNVLVPAATPTVVDITDNGSGIVRIELNSTAGLSAGDWLFFENIGGADYVNGNRKVFTVVDGTHIDVNSAFNGSRPYTSSGAVVNPTSMFVVGRYALMTGFDLQGNWLNAFGFPPNLHFFDFVKIDSVNTGTGQVCFETTLTNNYLSTWPNFSSGTAFEVDGAGPATLFALRDDWDQEIEILGITAFKSGFSQIYTRNRRTIWKDVTFSGSTPVPTLNDHFTCHNCSVPDTVEMDKLANWVELIDGSYAAIWFQSSSINRVTADGTTVTNFWQGTPKVFVGNNSTFLGEFRVGVTSYGASTSFSCTDCIIEGFIADANVVNQGDNSQGFSAAYSMTTGQVTIANGFGAGNADNPFPPGTNLRWVGLYSNMGQTIVSGVTQDNSNTYIQTTEPGGFPTYPEGGGELNLGAHPAPAWTCINCSDGVNTFSSFVLNNGDPLFSYYNHTVTDGVVPGAQGLWGTFVEFVVDVTQAYTGAQGTLSLHAAGAFGAGTIQPSDGAEFRYNPLINLKQAGRRVITPSGVTCDGAPGACSGDSALAMAEAYWIASNITPALTTDVSGECASSPAVCMHFNIEVTTNQGVVLPYLLKRDLNPAANDNTPMFLNQAA